MPDALVPAWLGELRPLRETLPARRPGLWPGMALLLLAVLLAGFGVAGREDTAHPDRLSPGPYFEQARARGRLIVGVRAYPRPALPGLPVVAEPDPFDAALARALGDYLGVPVETLGLSPERREAALREGRVDLLVAGAAADSGAAIPPSRRQGEGALVVLRGLDIHAGEGLRGRSLCLAEGSPYRRPLAERHGARLREYPSAVHAIAAFMAGECQALVEARSLVDWLLQQPDWRFYRRLPFELQAPASGHVRLADAEPQAQAWLAAVLGDWQRRGALDAVLAQRTGELAFDVLKLEQGLICH
ncbi:type 2 periplasmic-binding domain-containing protein [Azotobacter salinestris]|uniref:transporter substrate-binding domain-containing protein n=1 Tax=Azotobacter salinestris TaxID=69964 RepID=UPI001266E268|nr:transporter substrate-binding domain-containing protein [Azotobacter salinestris]